MSCSLLLPGAMVALCQALEPGAEFEERLRLHDSLHLVMAGTGDWVPPAQRSYCSLLLAPDAGVTR